jgi:DNA-binding MarR family transcriptional regulator
VAKGAQNGGKRPDSFANSDEILLGVLTAVERDANTSQRGISRELDVALGLANAYLKRCVRKGLIKIKQVPRRRYVYYLTPRGFAEKSRLAGQYFSASFTFFRRARAQMSELMSLCNDLGWHRIAFAGISELAEVGIICAHDFPVTVVAVVDPSQAGQRFCGLPVEASIEACGPVDAVIVTELAKPQQVHRVLRDALGDERVLTPKLLQLALPKEMQTPKADFARAAE